MAVGTRCMPAGTAVVRESSSRASESAVVKAAGFKAKCRPTCVVNMGTLDRLTTRLRLV